VALRSNDYYSSRNYAALIGSKLVFYTPLYQSVAGRRSRRSRPCAVADRRDAGRIQAHRTGDADLPHR
jgi:hypothetical protein